MTGSMHHAISQKRKLEFAQMRANLIEANRTKLIVTTLVLLFLGHLALFSASSAALIVASKSPYTIILRQLTFTSFGLLLMLALGNIIIPRLGEKALSLLSLWLFLLSLTLVALTLISPMGSESYGASRWLNLFGVRFQPFEFLKFACPFFLSSFLISLERKGGIIHIKDSTGKFQTESRGKLPIFTLYLALTLSAVLVALQPHLGGAALIFSTSLATLWLMNVPMRSILKFILLILILASAIYFAMPQKFEHARERVKTLFNPMKDPTGEGYQIIQSIKAISEAGLFGKGYMNGLQKYGRLPLADRDFIFAVWTEETGLIGALIVIGLFLFYILIIIRTSALLPFGFEKVTVTSLGTLLVLQALLNIGSNVQSLPVSGLTLPFFSYGGSSMISSLITVGIILGLIRRPASSNSRIPLGAVKEG